MWRPGEDTAKRRDSARRVRKGAAEQQPKMKFGKHQARSALAGCRSSISSSLHGGRFFCLPQLGTGTLVRPQGCKKPRGLSLAL